MKRIIYLLLLFVVFKINAQENVFILVDVSRSVSQTQLNNAKQALNEVLTGNPLTSAFVAQGNPNDLMNFKLAIGDKLALSKFGNITTTLAISPSPTQISNLTTDVSQVLNSMSWLPSDNQTYITLSKAKISEYAKNNGITNYKLYVISDNVQDDYGPGGVPVYPNDYTIDLVEGYNTSTNPVREAGYTKIKFNNTSLFTLSFSPEVDVSQYSLPGASTVSPATIVKTPSSLKIEMTSLKNGTTAKPKEIKTDKFTISWSCIGAPSNAQYKVRLSPLKIQGAKTQVFTTAGNSYNLSNLTDGKYRITVSSAQPNLIASSSSTIIEVKANSSMAFLWVLLLLGAAGAGYWFWNKKRNEKMETAQKTNDVFSSDGNDNSSSEYF